MSNFGKPRAATEADILDIIARFGRTAGFVKAAGFDGVQIHSAHGYLLSQFLSPRTNQRSDEWGGPLVNRARLLLKVIQSVRAAVGPDYPISVKLNSADFRQRRLRARGVSPGRALARRRRYRPLGDLRRDL